MNTRLNREVLCKVCKRKEIRKLANKCGNKKMARFFYHNDKSNIRWIPFDEFRNIKYLAKGGFGEVHKATWINGYRYYNEHHWMEYKDEDVVLKRIHNSSDKIVDILKEVKVHY